MPCPWWCRPHDEVECDHPHSCCVSIISSGDDATETADVAVLLGQPVGPMGADGQGRTLWIWERVAVDLSDGDDEVPALLLLRPVPGPWRLRWCARRTCRKGAADRLTALR